jgi:hypothetical protein
VSNDGLSNEQVHGMLDAAIGEAARLARAAPEAFVIAYAENWEPHRERMGAPGYQNGGHIWISGNSDEAYQLASDLYDAECEASHPENRVYTLRAAEWAHRRIKRLEALKKKVLRTGCKEISEEPTYDKETKRIP